MKNINKILLQLALFSLSCGEVVHAAGAESPPIQDKWAVVVGISKNADASIAPAPFAAKNASDFSSFLINSEHFAPDHVHLLLDEKATRISILNEINRFLGYATVPGDLVVIYLSGPGSPSEWDAHGVGYLMPYDAEKQTLFSTGIALSTLPQDLGQRVHADRVVFFTDVSYSGGAPKERVRFPITRSNPAIVINACKSDEKTCDSKALKSGVFTHYLIEDLRKAGPDSVLSIALKELPDQVASAAKKESAADQHVTGISNQWTFDPPIGVTPARPRSAP